MGVRDSSDVEPLLDGYRDGLGLVAYDLDMRILNGMGTTLLASSMGSDTITTTFTLADQVLYGVPLYLPRAATLTGAAFYQSTQGNYTANNNSRIGLYTSDNTNLTKVASTTHDATLWKGTASTYVQKAFTSTYAASAGSYWLLFLWCRSAQVTAPVIGAAVSLGNTGVNSPANGAVCFNWSLAAQTDIPATTQAWAGVTGVVTQPWMGVY